MHKARAEPNSFFGLEISNIMSVDNHADDRDMENEDACPSQSNSFVFMLLYHLVKWHCLKNAHLLVCRLH